MTGTCTGSHSARNEVEAVEQAKNGTSTQKLFSASTRPIADAIISVVDDLREYWPLTVRQIFYQLVGKTIILNNLAHYRKVSRILVKLREEKLVPWSVIEDRSRRTTEKRGFTNVSEWLREQLSFLDPKYYGRCRVQDQDVYVEVSTEKDALSSILEEVLWPYCTRLNVVRGQNSATIVEQMASRFDQAVMRGQEPILLHFGDLDPSGRAIPRATQKNFLKRHGIDVDVRTVALTPGQVKELNLPHSLDAVKRSDPNYKAWLRELGPDQPAIELDAVHPKVLKQLLRDALASTYDMDGMNAQCDVENQERRLVRRIRDEIKDLIIRHYPEVSWY